MQASSAQNVERQGGERVISELAGPRCDNSLPPQPVFVDSPSLRSLLPRPPIARTQPRVLLEAPPDGEFRLRRSSLEPACKTTDQPRSSRATREALIRDSQSVSWECFHLSLLLEAAFLTLQGLTRILHPFTACVPDFSSTADGRGRQGQIIVIPAVVFPDLPVWLDRQRTCDDLVEKCAIVAYEQHCSLIRDKQGLEELKSFDVEVVGGLVQHQKIRRFGEEPLAR